MKQHHWASSSSRWWVVHGWWRAAPSNQTTTFWPIRAGQKAPSLLSKWSRRPRIESARCQHADSRWEAEQSRCGFKHKSFLFSSWVQLKRRRTSGCVERSLPVWISVAPWWFTVVHLISPPPPRVKRTWVKLKNRCTRPVNVSKMCVSSSEVIRGESRSSSRCVCVMLSQQVKVSTKRHCCLTHAHTQTHTPLQQWRSTTKPDLLPVKHAESLHDSGHVTSDNDHCAVWGNKQKTERSARWDFFFLLIGKLSCVWCHTPDTWHSYLLNLPCCDKHCCKGLWEFLVFFLFPQTQTSSHFDFNTEIWHLFRPRTWKTLELCKNSWLFNRPIRIQERTRRSSRGVDKVDAGVRWTVSLLLWSLLLF